MKEHVENYIKQYNSFSGTDMVATIHIIGPDGNPAVYTLGTLQTVTTSVHMDRKPIRSIGNINVKDYVMGPRTIAGTLIFAVFNKHFAYEAIDAILNDKSFNRKFGFLADELPPFDITISFANEYGCKARLAIYGIRLVNEGQVMSVNDIYTENTYQYVATDYEYLSDDNGHSNYNSNNSKKIVSGKSNKSNINDSTINSTDLKNDSQKAEYINTSTQKGVTISCKTTNAKDVNSLGKVKITLDPLQEKGIVLVFDIQGNMIRTVYIDDFPNEAIYLSLNPSQYVAQYQDSERELLIETQFYIGYNSNKKEKVNVAPTITNRTSETITVVSNNKKHDTLAYTEKTMYRAMPKRNIAKINGSSVTLNNLKPGVFYEISTFNNKEKENKSDTIYINTLKDNELKYDYILEQLLNNKIILPSDIKSYKTIISLCKQKSKKFNFEISLLDSLIYTKLELEKHKNSNEELLRALNDIEEFVEQTSNNEQYYINSNCNSEANKQPEVIDKINNTIKLTNDIACVDVFKIKNGQQIFVKTIDDNKKFNITDQSGCVYELISKGKYGELNPKTQFYNLEDDCKSSYYNKECDFNDLKSSLIDTSAKELSPYVSFEDLELDIKNRILYQNAKKPVLKILDTPFIDEIRNNSIVVNTNNKHYIGNQSKKYFLTFSDGYNLFKSNIKNKKLMQNNEDLLKISREFFVFKNNETYYMWIEDENGIQLSSCNSFKINNDTNRILIENKIASNYTDKIISDIKRNEINDYLKDILFNLKTDQYVNEYNIFDKLIDKVLVYTTNTIDKSSFLFDIFKAKFDEFYVSENFFEEPIRIKNHKLIFPKSKKSYEIIQFNISSNNETNQKNNILFNNNEITINSKYDYTLLFCQNHNDIYIKSGFILIDNKTLKHYNFKIKVNEVN